MELNDDGLIPGQPVDFETIMRVRRQPKVEPQLEIALDDIEDGVEDADAEIKPRRGRKPKAAQ